MISLRGGGSALRIRISSGSRHLELQEGAVESHQLTSPPPVVEKYDFIGKAAVPSSRAVQDYHLLLFKGPMVFG